MPDGFDTGFTGRHVTDPTARRLDRARTAFATARLKALAEQELHLFQCAVQAPDDDVARRLELRADTVWRDALALSEEHDIEIRTWLQ